MLKKILLIEDEPEHRMMVKMRLEANGFEVVTAQDGEKGLRKVTGEKPDLILLDIVLPKLDGIEVTRRLKDNPDTSSIPVLIITASGFKDVAKRCREAGADDFIMKPYNPNELLGKINALCKG